MTTPMVHQESEDRSLYDGPSLFVEEWVTRCAIPLVSNLKQGGEPLAVYCQFRESHPALFLGVYLSPKMALWRNGAPMPAHRYEDDRLWLDSWGVESPYPVELVRVPRHRLVILVALDSVLVLCESELVEALGGSSPAAAEPAIGGGA